MVVVSVIRIEKRLFFFAQPLSARRVVVDLVSRRI